MIVRLNRFIDLSHKFSVSVPLLLLSAGFAPSLLFAQNASFHDAPASAKTDQNPYAGKADAAAAGKAACGGLRNNARTCFFTGRRIKA